MNRIFLAALALLFVAAACNQGQQEWKSRDRSGWRQDTSDWGEHNVIGQREQQTGDEKQVWGRQRVLREKNPEAWSKQGKQRDLDIDWQKQDWDQPAARQDAGWNEQSGEREQTQAQPREW